MALPLRCKNPISGKTSDLTPEQLSIFQKAFDVMDRDSSGTISGPELSLMLGVLGNSVTRRQVKDILKDIDADGSGDLDMDEFLTMMAKSYARTPEAEAELRTSFKLFDMDGNGTISPQELHDVMKSFGEDLEMEQVQDMIGQADIDMDGCINYEEYAMMMCSISQPNDKD